MKILFTIALLFSTITATPQLDTLRHYDSKKNLVSEQPTIDGVVNGTCRYWTSSGMLWGVVEVENGELKVETTYSETGISHIAIHKKNHVKKTAYFPNGNIKLIKTFGKQKVELTEWDSLGQILTYFSLKKGCEIICFGSSIDDGTEDYDCSCGDREVFFKEGIYVDSNDVPINKKAFQKEISYFANGKKRSVLIRKGQDKTYFRKWNADGVLIEKKRS